MQAQPLLHDAQPLIHEVLECLSDGEVERATFYFGDVRAAVRRSCDAGGDPRIGGAIAQSLAGIEHALEHAEVRRAVRALRHLAYLIDEQARGG
jgi:hypothetical protein